MIVTISKNKVEVADEPTCGLLLVYEWIYNPEEDKVYLKQWRDYAFDE